MRRERANGEGKEYIYACVCVCVSIINPKAAKELRQLQFTYAFCLKTYQPQQI